MKQFTILITGSNRGLGLEFVKQYAQENWQVIATCRSPDKAEALQDLIKQYSNIRVHPLDVTNERQILDLGIQLKDQPIDILLNNAGIMGPAGVRFGNVTIDPWLEVLKINTIAPLMLAQAFISNISRSEKKIIAVMSSQMGSIADSSSEGRYIYKTSKTALNMIIKTMARDLQAEKVTCVAFNPGWVRTDMGGSDATLLPSESVSQIRHLLDHVNLKDSGKFFHYDGREIAW